MRMCLRAFAVMSLMAIALGIIAAPLSRQQALDAASHALARQGIIFDYKGRAMAHDLTMDGQAVEQHNAYYVFNGVDAFVIAAGDDRLPAVLGYGSGNFDNNNMPPALSLLLDNYAQQARHATLQGRAVTPVKPFVTCRWGQGAPFNALCPVIDNDDTRAATGSSATALAQVLYYYKWPIEVSAVLPAYVSTDLNLMMPDVYPDLFPRWNDIGYYYPTDVDADPFDMAIIPIAKLMLYCGSALQTNYGKTSSARTAGIVEALPRYFQYAPTLKYVQRSYFTANQWYEMLVDEIRQRRPVIYRAQRWNGVGYAFVCDGIDSEGRVHINWGHHGAGDGYYLLTELYPQFDDINTDVASDGLNYQAAMIVGITPHKDDTQYVNPGQLSFYNLTIPQSVYTRAHASLPFDAVTVTGRFNNGSPWVDRYELGFALYDAVGNIVKEAMSIALNTLYPSFGAKCDWKLAVGDIAPGDYTLRAVSRVAGDSTWQVCIGADANYAIVSVSDTTMTITPCGNSAVGAYNVVATSLSGTLQATRASTITATLTNVGNRELSYIYLQLDSTTVSVTPCELECGATGNIALHFTPATAGEHLLCLTLDPDGNEVIYSTRVSIQEAAQANLSLMSPRVNNIVPGRVVVSGSMEVATVATNTGTATYNDEIVARLYRYTGDSRGVLHAVKTAHVNVEPGEAAQVKVQFDHLTPNEQFRTSLAYYSQGKLTGVVSTLFYTIMGDPPQGDVNGDRSIDVIDLNSLINILLGRSLKVNSQGREDVNEDGAVDINDVNSLINLLLKKGNDS